MTDDAAAELELLRAGLRTTIQDLGRFGLAHLGVPRSGAADRGSLRLANRLVGNPDRAAALEITLGNCVLRATRAVTLALTGAYCPIRVGDRPGNWALPVAVPAGATIRIGPAITGMRAYLAFSGGIVVPEVLGSRSTDTLSGLGPTQVRDGDVLPLGPAPSMPPGVDLAPYPPARAEVVVDVRLGPRDDWFTPAAITTLCTAEYTVSTHTDRIGARLHGPALTRSITGELRSEGLVLGAVQVPADGQPLIFLADHPTTGGYPVVAVAEPSSVDAVAQARPGTRIRFRPCPDHRREARRTAGNPNM